MVYNLPDKHLNGRVFFGFRDRPVVDPDAYFQLIPTLKPLFARDDFTASTPGFFVNYIRDRDNPKGTLRLNYFTTNPAQTIAAIDAFVAQSGTLTIQRTEHADPNGPPSDFDVGNDKAVLIFRNFLDANTRICLDMIENFGAHSFASLVAFYRFIALPRRVRPEEVFEKAFAEHSATFNELRDNGLAGIYWSDLLHMHLGDNVGLHFMVNLVTLPDPPYSL